MRAVRASPRPSAVPEVPPAAEPQPDDIIGDHLGVPVVRASRIKISRAPKEAPKYEQKDVLEVPVPS